MAVSTRYIFAAAALAVSAIALGQSDALASCNRCTGGPVVPPPVSPPPPPPPPVGCARPGCGHGGVKVVVPPVVIPPPSVTITHGGPQIAVSTQRFTSSVVAGGGGMFLRGAGLVGDVDQGVSGGMLNVMGARSETITREVSGQRVIQATCVDDRGGVHDASQTFGESAVPASFDGEIYRCMAGSKMRVAVGKLVDGKASFDGARTFECAKGEALVHRGGQVSCVTQEAKRPCNERSLLRRFGPGMKVVMVRETETTVVERRQMLDQSMQMSFDGGVGQSVW